MSPQAIVLDPQRQIKDDTIRKKDTKAQENAISDNVKISTLLCPLQHHIWKPVSIKSPHGSLDVIFFFKVALVYRTIVDLPYCVSINCMGN